MDGLTPCNADAVDAGFGPRMLKARNQALVTQPVLAAALGLHVTAIGKIERGERRVTVGEAVIIANTIGVPLLSLLGQSSEVPDPELAQLRAFRARVLAATACP